MNVRAIVALVAFILMMTAIWTGPPDFKDHIVAWYFTTPALILMVSLIPSIFRELDRRSQRD
jgi:hypothetical protein